MMYYASRTGTKRNLAAMREAGWHLLVSRAGVWRHEGFPYALDNGAWADFQANRAFDEPAFARLLDKMADQAEFVVAPDIVAGGMRSLELTLLWLDRCQDACKKVLIAVQDGMTSEDVAPLVGPSVGIFLGGTTEWKLSTMTSWGLFCADRRIHYHVGRVNTGRRIRLAAAAGATSVDGSSGTRFAVTIPQIDGHRRQYDLFTPRIMGRAA